jgi:hypothetical protein
MASKERFLLLRYGGIGDALFLTPVAKKLTELGYQVDVVVNDMGLPVLENNPYIKHIYLSSRFGTYKADVNGHPINLVDYQGVYIADMALYRLYKTKLNRPWRPFNVANYFRVIEANTQHPEISPTQNSTYINTYDNHLNWAGINPYTMSDDEKRPNYFVREEERAWAKSILSKCRTKPVFIQTTSSSAAKTISPLGISRFLIEKGHSILLWNQEVPTQERPQGGGFLTINGMKIEIPKEIKPIRATAALLEQCQFAITADTGVSHLAEALGIRHITYYTFVPAHTISKYYRYEITVDSQVTLGNQVCKCYQITRDCPRKQVEAWSKLDPEERQLLEMLPMEPMVRAQAGLPPVKPLPTKDPITYFKCTSEATLNAKVNNAFQKLESLRMEIPYCTASIDLVDVLTANYSWLKGETDAH